MDMTLKGMFTRTGDRDAKLTIVAIRILTSVTIGDATAHSGTTGIVNERMDYFKASQ